MNIKELLISTSPSTTTIPRLDLELLIAATLKRPRSFLYAHPEYLLTPIEEQTLYKLLQRRRRGEPLAYILGYKEFWSLDLQVSPAVLIPRPETELLVETLLNHLTLERAAIAELGTGSGAIAIALAQERPQWFLTATDISKEALQLASINSAHYKLSNIEFYHGDWLAALPEKKFDAIISNPPYLAATELSSTLKFEPHAALVAENGGIAALATIIAHAPAKLKTQGLLLLEHGYKQSALVQRLLTQYNYHHITSYQDLAGIERVVSAITP